MSDSLEFLKSQLSGPPPEIAVVLGSGLGFFADEHITTPTAIPYGEIPGFLQSTVEGHAGRLVFGTVGGRRVVCMQGRFHYYEGYSLAEITDPIRLFARLGVTSLILTNAAGGIRESFEPGALMLIDDHINFLGANPLRGPNHDDLGPRFPDMSTCWHPDLNAAAATAAESLGIPLERGVYLANLGPSYETPAEIRAFRTLGADAVGMSTVPEAIVANHAGMRVCGISCITNKAAGLSAQALSHEEVTETANQVKTRFAQLLERLVTTAPA